nr:methylmalonyl Co-A mutase-associated GTPase MeaB [Flavobacteriales bacterium]
HQELAQQILEKCMPKTGKSIRIGITGVPGVGKSTFIESFGKLITSMGKKVAVLAIDPSSEQGRGSILGDKTRMEELSKDALAFIRPSPNAGSLGGVARKTRESILLCEAAGYEVIIVETVGVGQSETAVHSMIDFFLLLMLAGAGDELQGIKRGIMEMADAIAITKADGDNLNRSKTAVGDYKRAIHLFPAKSNHWIPKVLTCSSYENQGITEIWETISSFVNHGVTNDYFEENRKKQAQFWLHESILEHLENYFYENPKVKAELAHLEKEVALGEISPFVAANQLITLFRKS